MERRPPQHVAEDVEFLLQHHPWTITQISDRLGYSEKSGIQNALKRAGRTDLLAQLAQNGERAGLPVTRRKHH